MAAVWKKSEVMKRNNWGSTVDRVWASMAGGQTKGPTKEQTNERTNGRKQGKRQKENKTKLWRYASDRIQLNRTQIGLNQSSGKLKCEQEPKEEFDLIQYLFTNRQKKQLKGKKPSKRFQLHNQHDSWVDSQTKQKILFKFKQAKKCRPCDMCAHVRYNAHTCTIACIVCLCEFKHVAHISTEKLIEMSRTGQRKEEENFDWQLRPNQKSGCSLKKKRVDLLPLDS